MAILTLSREFGSCGDSIGRMVAESTEYTLVDKDTILREVSRRGKNWEAWSRELDERCPSLWEKFDWSFRGFAALIQTTILQFARQGNVVIVGRGANFVLRPVPHALTVRVVSDMEARMERIKKSEHLSTEGARRLILGKDQERKCFIHAIHGKDWADPAAYELLFDTGVQSEVQIVSSLVASLKERERLNTEESRAFLALLAGAAHVKAGLLVNPRIFVPILEVIVKGNQLVLEGVIHNQREKEYVEESAKELAGEFPLETQLRYRF